MSHFYHFNHRILLKRQAPKKTKREKSVARGALKSIDRARALIECEIQSIATFLLLLLLVFFWYALG